MIKKLKRNLRLFALSFIAIAFSAAAISIQNQAYAGSGGTGTDGWTGCSACGTSNRSTCVCDANGFTWVYYKLTNHGKGRVFKFPGRSTTGYGTISGCNTEGFWHLGYDIRQGNETVTTGLSYSSNGSDSSSTTWKYTAKGTAGQIGTRDVDYFNGSHAGGDARWASNRQTLGFSLKADGAQVAYASKYGSRSHATAQAAFNKAVDTDPDSVEIKKSNGSSYNPKKYYKKNDFHSVAWFCYSDDRKGTFTGSSSASGSGSAKGTVTTENDFKMTFTHTIKRVSGDGFPLTNSYSTNPKKSKKTNPGPDAPKKVSDKWKSNKSGDKIDTIKDIVKGKIIPGDTIEYCSSLNYYDELHTVSTGKNHQTTTKEVCRKLTRVNRTVEFTANTKVYADEGNSATTERAKSSPYKETITAESGKFTVKFVHTVTRGKITKSVPAGYTTDASFSMDNNYITVVKDTGNYYSGNKKSTVHKKRWVSSKKGEKATVTDLIEGEIYPNQTITFCQHIDYQTSNNERNTALNENTASNKTSTTNKCVTITRKKATCNAVFNDEPYQYGYDRGWNVGYLKVSNSTLGNTATTPHSPEDYATTGKIIESSIYARPGDLISYEYQFCAGAQYPNLRNEAGFSMEYNASGDSNVASNANKKKYLFDSQVTHYNTSSNPSDSDTTTIRQPRTWNNAKNSKTQYKKSDGQKFPYDFNSLYAKFSNPGPSDKYTKYDCAISGAPTNSSQYQVTGMLNATSTCKTNTLDVGGEFSQTVKWNDYKFKNITWNSSNKFVSLNYEAPHDGTKKNGAKGTVKVPYNYNLDVYAKRNVNTNDKYVTYRGAELIVETGVIVHPRKNTAVSNNNSLNTYATITKPTKVTTEWYVLDNHDNRWHSPTYTSSAKKVDENVRFNKTGRLNGTIGNDASGTVDGSDGRIYKDVKAIVPDDVPLGYRVCVDISVYPRYSHNADHANSGSTSAVAMQSTPGTGASELLRTACYTVAKKPMISVEGSNAYASGDKGFLTSRYSKDFNTTNKITFGSWSEYGVYGKSAIDSGRGFASGATFGYATSPTSTKVTMNGERHNNINNIAKNLDDTSGPRICIFTTQTFVNANCSTTTGTAGAVGVGQKAVEQYRERTYDRFKGSSKSKDIDEDEYGANCYSGNGDASSYGCIKSGSTKYAIINKWLNDTWDENGVNRTHIEGNSYLGSASDSSNYTLWTPHNFNNNQTIVNASGETVLDRNHTRVIETSGTMVIDGNIIVGDRNNHDDDPVLNNTGEIAQVVIVARKVEITSRVNQIDAIILADEVDTCAYTSVNKFINGTRASIGGGSGKETINSTDESCSGYNNATGKSGPLIFSGPVFTKKITLNRTYGASSSTSSIKRAEIFYLDPYNYLWSFGQMSRYSQAVTTYSRELPSRY